MFNKIDRFMGKYIHDRNIGSWMAGQLMGFYTISCIGTGISQGIGFAIVFAVVYIPIVVPIALICLTINER